MTEIDFTTEPIELIDTIKSIIVDYYEWFIGIYDLSNINSVDELPIKYELQSRVQTRRCH